MAQIDPRQLLENARRFGFFIRPVKEICVKCRVLKGKKQN